MAEAARLDRPAGIIIDTVTAGSPAARAGIQQGDVISAVDGKPVDDPQALKFRLATKPVGGQVTLHVLRGGKARDMAMKLEAPPENPPRNLTQMKEATPLQGASAANLNPALAQEKGYADGSGVVLVEVPQGSQAARLGFAEGDMIVSINDSRIAAVADLVRALSAAGGRWQIAIRRDGQMRSMSFSR
jgi:S1-C subfamily serine protease